MRAASCASSGWNAAGRKIVLRISSFVVSGWIVQSRRTFFPFSSVVKTPAYPLEIICLEICRFRLSFSSSVNLPGLKRKLITASCAGETI